MHIVIRGSLSLILPILLLSERLQLVKSFFNNKLLIIGLGIGLLNLLFKGFYLSYHSLGGDEIFSVYHAQMDVVSIAKLLSKGNNPPLYEIILHFWVQLFGISPFSVRFPSLIFSSVTAVFIFLIGSKFFNIRIALSASVFFVFSNYHIFFAHEARTYALLGMLSVVSMYVFMDISSRFTSSDKSEKTPVPLHYFLLLSFINVCLIYAHYFGFFILAIQMGIWFFSSPFFKSNRKSIFIYLLVIIALYLPNLSVLITRFTASSGESWVQAPDGIKSLYYMLWLFSNQPILTVIILLIGVIAFIRFVSIKARLSILSASSILVLWFVFIFFFMFVVSFKIPVFLDRYLMPAAVAFPLFVAFCCDYILYHLRRKEWAFITLSILFIATSNLNVTNKRDVRGAVNKIVELKDEKTMIVICPSDFTIDFSYYYNIDIFRDFHTDSIHYNINKRLKKEHIQGIDHIREVDISGFDKVLFLDVAADYSRPNNWIKQTLIEHFDSVEQYDFYEIFSVYVFKKPVNLPSQRTEIIPNFHSSIQ